jgi:hypothetical protein
MDEKLGIELAFPGLLILIALSVLPNISASSSWSESFLHMIHYFLTLAVSEVLKSMALVFRFLH